MAIGNNIEHQETLMVTNRSDFPINTGLDGITSGNEIFVVVSASSPIAR